MARATVRIKGLRELQRSLQKVNKGAAKTVRDELKEVAGPVVATIKQKEARWPGASISTIGPRASVRGVFVTQRARKVTGKRGDFGALQQVQAFEPALEEHEDDVKRGVERAFDRLLRSARL